MKSLWLCCCLLVACPVGVQAVDFTAFTTTAQWSDKLVGVTIIEHCPTTTVLAEMDAETVRLQADYVQIVQVPAESLCPATIYGQLYSYVRPTVLPDGQTIEVGAGVTVGLHYRRQKP